MELKDFIKALKEGQAYDFIANNGYSMSKDELITIIKEFLYFMYSSKINKDDYIEFEKELAEAIEDYIKEYEEE